MRVKVKNDPHFEKDLSSKAVLNVDKDALFAYKKQRKIIATATNVSNEIEDLKKDVDEIKTLLYQLINR